MSISPSYDFIPTQDDTGLRLDKFLTSKIADLSRARIQSIIQSGHVTIQNQIITQPAHKIKSGHNIAISIPALQSTEIKAQTIDLDILYEDKDLLVINKPPGMVVHPAAGNWDQTLVNALLAHCEGSLSGIGGEKRPGIVHRIDKDTSGILVVAKHDAAHQGLSAQFTRHSIKRVYQAFVWGTPKSSKGTIQGNIARSAVNRKKMATVKTGGKHAVTHYRVIKNYAPYASIVECTLETGRTHQIRVHMTQIGHPLIGDKVYGKPRKISALEKDLSDYLYHFPRQALHAKSLGFTHPMTQQWMEFEACLPVDLQILTDNLDKIG